MNCCFIDKLEGDIKLTPNVEAIVAEGVKTKGNNKPAARGAVSDKIYLWTNGVVPYVIDSAFGKCSESERFEIRVMSHMTVNSK